MQLGKKKKKNNLNLNQTESKKLSMFTDDIILYFKNNPKDTTK